MFTQGELKRYDRQMMMEEIGTHGQEKLKRARIFIAGAGGLGSTTAIYLAAAGIGLIKIADSDRVELSNLNRQVLHWEEDIGKKKIESAKDKLTKLNPNIKVEIIYDCINQSNVMQMLDGIDVIVDAMDNLATRYILNKAAIKKNIPFFHGAVNGFEGEVMDIIPGKTACLRCMYHGEPPSKKFPVIGATTAVIGSIQAMEVIKYIAGIGDLLVNRLLIFDGLDMKFKEFKVKKNPECEHCGNIRNRQ
jgi:molybdopterin/thiamine biosynthesis adenylyltransferase